MAVHKPGDDMLEPQALRDLIARTPLFAGLAPADLDAVASAMRNARFEAGQLIFSRGDAGQDIYVVAEGRVRLSILTGDGRELSFAQVGPGKLFGEIAMLDGGARTADATAVTKVVAATLSKAAYVRTATTRPAIGEAMTRFLCARIRDADHQLETIALYPIEGRLARFLLAAVALKEGGARKVALELGMSQNDLALLVGASRPKVNAALALLEGCGAIKRVGNRIDCDVDQLRSIAGSE